MYSNSAEETLKVKKVFLTEEELQKTIFYGKQIIKYFQKGSGLDFDMGILRASNEKIRTLDKSTGIIPFLLAAEQLTIICLYQVVQE